MEALFLLNLQIIVPSITLHVDVDVYLASLMGLLCAMIMLAKELYFAN